MRDFLAPNVLYPENTWKSKRIRRIQTVLKSNWERLITQDSNTYFKIQFGTT